MKKKLFFVFIIISVVTCCVYAADWKRMDRKMYLDASSITPCGQYGDKTFSVWSKWMNNGSDSWKRLEKNKGKKLTYKKVQNIVDCENKKLAVKSMVLYDAKENAAGRYEKNKLEWYSVVPETMGEDIYSYVCRTKYIVRQRTIFGRSDNYIRFPIGIKTWERTR